MQPAVLKYGFEDIEHVNDMLEALRDARSWTCDRRSQVPCLRFVGSDGQRRIVAMEDAVIHSDDPRSKLDGHQNIADALRIAAISCLQRALLPVDEAQVEEAHERQNAYGTIVATQIEGIEPYEEFIVTASAPWRSATVLTFDRSGGFLGPKPRIEAPHADLCPIMFCVHEGDSGSLGRTSIGLGTCSQTWTPRIDVMEGLRAGAMLKRPWRNA